VDDGEFLGAGVFFAGAFAAKFCGPGGVSCTPDVFISMFRKILGTALALRFRRFAKCDSLFE
jgi:hypothetical protein